jgi:coenzyme F420-dependent glucose-6-phosphate dehydrogenase
LPKVDVQLDIGENNYEPMKFVETVQYAEQLGFKTAWLGDHFFPWYHSAGGSPFVWSTMGVALERTKTIKLGPLVTTPIGARYHPGIIAQASATLDNMYPGRFLLGVGSGEALNERPFWNGRWPEWEERMERLVEGVRLVRQLWESKKPFSFKGKFYSADFYYGYTKPKTKIPIYFSAVGKRAAYQAGACADALVTISPRNDLERLHSVILPAYRKGMKEGGTKKGRVNVHFSFTFLSPSETRKKKWRSLGWLTKDSWSIRDPVHVEKAGKRVTNEELETGMLFCKDWSDLVRVMQTYVDAGADEICLSSGAEDELIKEIRDNVLTVF